MSWVIHDASVLQSLEFKGEEIEKEKKMNCVNKYLLI